MSAGLAAYRAAAALAAPAVGLLLRRRLAAGREDAGRLGERLGVPGMARPAGGLVWVHAASIGESVSVLPLVQAICDRPSAPTVLVTSTTTASASMLSRRLPPGAIHQYAPVDTPGAVRGFLRHWRPDLSLLVESELWPTMLTEVRRSGIPIVLLNGRMSDRSYRRWSRAPSAAVSLLRGFALCLARSPEQAARLRSLGALKVRCVGDLKDAADPLTADGEALDRLRAAVAGRPVWLAASTHPGEEELVGAAHRIAARRHEALLTIIAPRHPERGEAVADQLRRGGLSVARRSAGDRIKPQTELYIADTIDELGLFYRLAPVALVGGSLVPHGGHNLLEPARLGCAVLHGPHVANFAETVSGMTKAGAAALVDDAAGLGATVDRLLADPAERQRLADAAAAFVAGRGRVLEAVLAELAPFLDPIRKPVAD